MNEIRSIFGFFVIRDISGILVTHVTAAGPHLCSTFTPLPGLVI